MSAQKTDKEPYPRTSQVLEQKVLVLNKHWIPVHICTVRRALTLVFQEFALIVNEDYRTYDFDAWRLQTGHSESHGPMIHAPGFELMMPQVIVLTRYSRIPPRAMKFNRQNIYARDNYTCQYCGERPPVTELTIDHVVPRSRGGNTDWKNVVVACKSCNTKKGSRLPQECNMIPASKPRKPAWTTTFVLQRAAARPQQGLWHKFINTPQWGGEVAGA